MRIDTSSNAREDDAKEEDAGAASEGHPRHLCDFVEVAAPYWSEDGDDWAVQ